MTKVETRLGDRRVTVEDRGQLLTFTAAASFSAYVVGVVFLTLTGGIAGLGIYASVSAVLRQEPTDVSPEVATMVALLFGAAFAIFVAVLLCLVFFWLCRVRIDVDALAKVCRVTRVRTTSIPLGEIHSVAVRITSDGECHQAVFYLQFSESRSYLQSSEDSLRLFCWALDDRSLDANVEECKRLGDRLAKALGARLVCTDTRPFHLKIRKTDGVLDVRSERHADGSRLEALFRADCDR